MKELAMQSLEAIQKAGAEHAQVRFTRAETMEINFQDNTVTLMRTVFNSTGSLTAVTQGRKGSLIVNQLDEAALREAAETVAEMAAVSQSDDANVIAEREEGPVSYDNGPEQGSKDKMMDRLEEFLDTLKREYPSVKCEGSVSFRTSNSLILNTNGVELNTRDGRYSFSFLFGAKEGEVSSSFNYTGAVSHDADKPFWEQGGLGMLIRQSVEELSAKPLGDKFTGDIVLSPLCTQDFLSMYIDTFLRTTPLIAGTSVLKDKLGQKVAAGNVTIVSDPIDPEVCGYAVTEDGFRAKPITILEDGTLMNFVVSQYGARKTGHPRSGNMGDMASLQPGSSSLEQLLGGVKRGLLVCRFSGGSPSENGDISGVAKNSFYIENGKIAFPVMETMVSGNLLEMFNSISDISADTIFDGETRQPWTRISGVVISGS